MKKELQRDGLRRMFLASNKDQSLGLPRQWKVITSTIILLFTMGIGQMWGTDQTYTVANPSAGVLKSGPITIQGLYKTNQKIDDVNQNTYSNKDGSLYIFSNAKNIKGISFDACSSSSGSGTENLATIKVQDGATFTAPTSGFTATKDGSNLTSLSNIAITKVQTTHTAVSVSFTTSVSAIEIAAGSASNDCRIKNISVIYDDAVTAPSLYSEGHFASTTAGTATNGCSWGEFTLNGEKEQVSEKDYYKRGSADPITYNLASGEKFAEGDVILFDFIPGTGDSKTVPLSLTSGPSWTQKTVAKIEHNYIYVIPSGSALINATSFSFSIGSNDIYVYGVRVYHNAAPATTYTVTYQSGAGTGDDVVDDATIVAGCPNTFTAPLGKVFAGWKNGDDDVAVGATVSATMTLVAQWADPTAPTITFNNSDYTVGETLDLSTLFTSNSEGAVTYTVKTAGTTGATIDGTSFTATDAGDAIVTATQAANGIYTEGSEDATITVLCSCAITTQPANKSINQTQANPELSIVATNAQSYAWYASSDGSSYDGSVVLGTEASYTPAVHETVGTTYYYCDVTSACDGTTIVHSNIATVAVSAVAGLAELVTINKDYTFTPEATVSANAFVLDGTDKVLLNVGGTECDYDNGLRIKENRALALKVADGAKVKVTFTKNGSRAMKLGTALTGSESSVYGSSSTSPVTFTVAAGRIVYLTATADLRISELQVTYPRTVTYNLNGGSGTLPTEVSHFAGDVFTVHDGVTGITAPDTKEFEKWVDQDAADVAGGSEYTMPAKAVTLTAQWRNVTVKYAVTYSLNGAPGDAPTSSDKAAGDEVTLTADPSWTGYGFNGWVVTRNDDSETVAVSEGKFIMPASAVTITAQWTLLETKIYSLTGAIGSAEVTADNASVSSTQLQLANTAGRIKLTPKTGETFKSGDVVTISGTIGNGSSADFGVTIYAANGSTKIVDVYVANSVTPRVATATLTADADYIFLKRYGGTTTTLLTCEITRPWAEGTTAGISYATAEVEKLTADAAFTNPLTNNNNLVVVYGSSDNSVATIDANGQVTLVGAGTTTITAKSALQTKSGTLYAAGTASYTLTVSTPPTYAVTYAKGDEGADGTMTDSNSPYVEGAEVTLLANTFTAPSGYAWSAWAVTETVSGDPVAVSEGKFTMPGVAVTVTAQWQLISDFDVKFFQGYGDPDVQIGETQSVSTGNYATAPATDPTREGYSFLGWSYDATEAHIVDVAAYGITAATNFTAMWKAVWTVTFDGAGNVIVEDGAKVASPDSPTQAGKVFQGWYNGEDKYDFNAVVTGNLALTSKWVDANANHYTYAYNDDFHFDGVVYKTPDGKTKDPEAAEASNVALATNPYTLFSGTAGITSIIATNGIYDYKKGAGTKHITAYLKLKADDATSNVVFTIASGYTAVLKLKMNGYSSNATISLKKGDDAVTPSGTQEGTAEGKDYGELTYNLTAGAYTLTTANKTLYVSHIDLEATALPTHSVTYKPGDGEGAWVVDADATEVADCPGTFTAPDGKVFNGWKNESDASDVAVGAIVEDDMNLIAQWINHYAVTFNMNGHGSAIDAQDIKHGSKATKPTDPSAIGWDFGGWFTDNGTFEGPFDFNTAITAATPLYAKWTEFGGCALLYPATSGDAPAVGAEINMQTGSFGATMVAIVKSGETSSSLVYNQYGLGFNTNGDRARVKVTLNHDIAINTKISITIKANGNNTSARGLDLYNASVENKKSLGWAASTYENGDVETFTYTAEENDGYVGTNEFYLYRNNTVILECLKVEACGESVIFHDLTSAVDPTGKGTVTLGASSVREGYTTTATYSDIDAAYEFDEWQISGTDATIDDAHANPAVITMGTEDAVVTLKLKVKPVYHTVTYYDGASEKGTEQVAENGHPTATGITTKKLGYTFLGWSETDGGAIADLAGITITADKDLFAKYEAIDCPTSGTVFSMVAKSNDMASDYQMDGSKIESLDTYYTVTNGLAFIGNGSSSKHVKVLKETSAVQLTGSAGFIRIALDCVLKENDTIKFDNTNKLIVSVDSLKTKKTNVASGTHYCIVPAAWADADSIYIWRDGNNVNFTNIQVIRPAKYTVSFDMKGHGIAPADIENVLDGSKIAAPSPAPTDEDYSFAGWYKETELENEWNFDVDVVNDNITLYAKWLDKSDATLKSLKYGTTEIELVGGEYTYNIDLPSKTTSVPALAAETSNPSAAKVIVNGTFDGEGNATSTVTVTPEVGADKVYTVNFTKLPAMPLLDVTSSTTWNFANAAAYGSAFTDEVLANFPGMPDASVFDAQRLQASGSKIQSDNLQGTPVKFHTTTPGKVRVEFSNTGSSARPYRYLVVNGVRTEYKSNTNASHVTSAWITVPAGDVILEGECVENGDGTCNSDNLNFYKIEFDATPDLTRDVTPGLYGTICYPTAGYFVGGTIYEIAYYDATEEKIFFDEIVNGEMIADRPYVFLPYEGVSTIGMVYSEAEQPEVTAGKFNGLHGTYVDLNSSNTTESPLWENYLISNNQYIRVTGSNCTLRKNRAYIVMSEMTTTPSEPRHGRRRIAIGAAPRTATGFENIVGDETPQKIMIDGTIYILRGEKLYDATGRLVK